MTVGTVSYVQNVVQNEINLANSTMPRGVKVSA